MTTLACNDLAIGYGSDTPLAAGITLTASAGEFVCLLGRNGVGKSTLLRTIAGLHPAASGTVHLGTRAVEPCRRHNAPAKLRSCSPSDSMHQP